MKYLLSTPLLFVLLLGLIAQAEPVAVRVELTDGKVYPGTLHSRAAGSVVFQQVRTEKLTRIPDSQIAVLKFKVEKKEEKELNALFDAGKYPELEEKLAAWLTPTLPYISFPSNQTEASLRWLAAAYWNGNYDRVGKLVQAFDQSPVDELRRGAHIYRGLTLLETGNLSALETFLKSPEADVAFPPNSAVRLYIEARLLQNSKEYVLAIRKAALLIALHSADADWMPRAELLCAELYGQLEMPESAESVITDINTFYTDPKIKEKAAAIAVSK
jgi:tetratricopeptide (TPR) repeat protein